MVEKAQGLWVHGVDGNIFLDVTAGIAVNATGHCHPEVVTAIQAQTQKLLHMSGKDFHYRPQILLAEKLASIVPGKLKKRAYFGNSGAEAVEAAFKLARWHTKRELNIAFFGGFHGRTMGALSFAASKTVQKKHYNPLCPASPIFPMRIVTAAPIISVIRSANYFVCVGLKTPCFGPLRLPNWRAQIIKTIFAKGLLLLGCGENSIRFGPSLAATAAEIDACLTMFEEVVKEVIG